MQPDNSADGDVFRHSQYRGVWIYRSSDNFYVVMATVDGEQTLYAESVLEAENIIHAFLDCE